MQSPNRQFIDLQLAKPRPLDRDTIDNNAAYGERTDRDIAAAPKAIAKRLATGAA